MTFESVVAYGAFKSSVAAHVDVQRVNNQGPGDNIGLNRPMG